MFGELDLTVEEGASPCIASPQDSRGEREVGLLNSGSYFLIWRNLRECLIILTARFTRKQSEIVETMTSPLTVFLSLVRVKPSNSITIAVDRGFEPLPVSQLLTV